MEKKKYSSLCVLGFIFSLAVPVPCFVYAAFNMNSYKMFIVSACFAIASMIVGLFLSIIGVSTSKFSGKKGRRLGIAGIIISLIGFACLILFCAGLIWLGKGLPMSN
ncbi:MAG: hypothetical protein IKG01_07100 [Lachnospiraceae bacterium]|nr:hypothetical protein [Lachnospiraceae bacterium]